MPVSFVLKGMKNLSCASGREPLLLQIFFAQARETKQNLLFDTEIK